MARGEIHVADVGTIFRVTLKDQDDVVVDVSAASSKLIILKKPDGTTVSKTASFYTDGTDGIIQWTTTLITDLDQDGKWKLQAKITIASAIHSSDIVTFDVYPNLS